LLKNDFSEAVAHAEAGGASSEDLKNLLGRSRAKLGMFDGDLEEGELEIGQVAAALEQIKPATEILKEIWQEFLNEKERLAKLSW
jgi:enoyl-[acyl-carrier protein] reductase II